MKRIIIMGTILLTCPGGFGQQPTVSSDKNYVITKFPQTALTSESQISLVNATMDISYFDGLGRLEQRIEIEASPEKNDIITPVVYDAVGRDDSETYLPYASSDNLTGAYRTNVLNSQRSFYSTAFLPADGAAAFAKKNYEASPLNRPISQFNVGAVFRTEGKSTDYDYGTNSSGEVLRFTLSERGSGCGITNMSYWPANNLRKTGIINEDSTKTCTYTNLLGHTVLERTTGEGDIDNKTYYIYDDYGNLCYVLPPELSAAIEDGNVTDLSDDCIVMEQYAYIYKYDSRNRCIRKRLPGTDWADMVYDKCDRQVLNRDGNMKDKGEWIYTVYDDLGRSVCQNIVVNAAGQTPEELQHKFHSSSHITSYPTLSDIWRTEIPFNDSSFEHIATLSEIRYGGYDYHSINDVPDYLDYAPVFFAESSSGNVIITEIMYDSPLNEVITIPPHTNGEYVELFNASASPVNMTGWKLTGGGSTEIYDFPAGTTIPAKGYLIIAYQYNNSGFTLDQLYSGITASGVLYQRKIILSNGGETVSVVDNQGNVVDAIFYDGTSNKTKPDRLSAANQDSISGMACMSLQRTIANYDTNGFAIAANSDWITASVSPFSVSDIASLCGAVDELDDRTKGLLTYEKVAVVDGGYVMGGFVERAFYYDYKGRVIQSVEKNHMGGISRYSTKYDFVGNVLASSETHQHSPAVVADVKLTEFTYDHRGRLLSETTTLNDGEPAIVKYGYDELGKLVSKKYAPQEPTLTHRTVQIQVCQDWSFVYDKATVLDDSIINTFFSEYLLEQLGIDNWFDFEYFKDGQVNPAYYICSKGGSYTEGYYYFPILEGGFDELDLFDLIMDFEIEFDVSLWSDPHLHGFPSGVTPVSYITLNKPVEPDQQDLGIVSDQSEGNSILETYTYNIQGWLTDKTSDVFEMRLRYYDPQKPATEASYTGNITEWEWNHKGADADSILNTYAFSYDKLSRLTDTERYIGDSATPVNSFTERNMTYDRNGNMLTMKRYGNNPTIPDSDMLTVYNGNQLGTVSCDGSSYDYDYDANGNMISDGRNALKLNYNFLNLTGTVCDTADNVRASYRWLADGKKAGVKNASETAGYEYIGSLVYARIGADLKLESAGFSAGRIMVSEGAEGTIYTPNYYITDHLGSTRSIYDGSETIARSDFLPFGTRWDNGQAATSRYQFTGYEDQELIDRKYMDAGARFYDGLRYNTIDHMAEKHSDITPYAYCGNNPINRIDPNGMDWYSFEEEYFEEGVKRTRKHYVYRDGEAEKWLKEKNGFKAEGLVTFNVETNQYYSLQGSVFDMKNNKNEGESAFLKDVNTIWQTSFNSSATILDDTHISINYGRIAGFTGKSTGGILLAGTTKVLNDAADNFRLLQTESTTLNLGLDYSTELAKVAKYAKYAKVAGVLGTAASFGVTELQWRKGHMTPFQRYAEHTVTSLSIIPVFGTAISIGWEAGKAFGPSKW